MNKSHFLILIMLAALVSSCNVEFSPNAEWKDVPSVYCVLDPEEDTVWARVQRCYLSEDNLYQYSQVFDSINYAQGDISVQLLAWKGVQESNNGIRRTEQLVHRWDMEYTLRRVKPEGAFASGPQPMFYCVPGHYTLRADTSCVFQLVVTRTSTGDTLASAFTTLVGFVPFTINGRDTTEHVVDLPNDVPGRHFAFIPKTKNEIKWYTLPRGRRYQPHITFYYRKKGDTLSVDIPGDYLNNQYNSSILSSKSITQSRFLSVVKSALAGNKDTLMNVNHVDVIIYVCNEDLNAYLASQDVTITAGQDFQVYSNIEGGVGVFGSRRSHIRVQVPCDSTGKPDYLPAQLKDLGVGFYGHFE
ncbi:MAG: DUF4249 family protein [Bacteroidales bacterium]|nr:DUF4249 family protein [Bacteroidales bacterium]